MFVYVSTYRKMIVVWCISLCVFCPECKPAIFSEHPGTRSSTNFCYVKQSGGVDQNGRWMEVIYIYIHIQLYIILC